MLAQNCFDAYFTPLLTSFSKEIDLEAAGAFGEAVSSCLQISYENASTSTGTFGLRESDLPAVLTALVEMATSTSQNMMARKYQNTLEEDFDEEMAAQQEEEDELESVILTSIVDSIGWLVKLHGAALLPALTTHVLPLLGHLFNCTLVPSIRGQAICTMDDIIEHCGPSAHSLLPTFLPCILEGLLSKTASVRQAAAYGVSVCAEFAGAYFDAHCQQALEKLVHVIRTETFQETHEDQAATDNAIAAVAKLCVHRQSVVDAAVVFPMWLTWLPLRSDLIEAREIHAFLIQMVENGSQELVGDNYCNLPAILQAFANILILQQEEDNEWDEREDSASVIDEDSKVKLFSTIQLLRNQAPAEVVKASWMQLSAEQQHVFQ